MKKSRLALLLGLVILSSCQTVPPQKSYRVGAPPPSSVPKSVPEILSESHLAARQVGYLVYDLDKKRILASQNADSAFLPASVNKVATTLAALAILGANYRFQTSLAYRGKVRNGVLNGDLYLKGTGDPMLTASELMDLALTLRRKGIREVSGRLYYDATFFPDQSQINRNFDEDAAYNSSVSALSSEFNRFRLRWSPGDENGTLQAYTLPQLAWMHLMPETKGRQFAYAPLDGEEGWTLPSDARRKAGERDLPTKNGARYTATLFATLCRSFGLAITDSIPGTQPFDVLTIATHESAPLLELVKRDLEYSNNLMTELFVLAAGRRLAGRSLPINEATNRVTTWLENNIKDIDWTGYQAENGSGLTPQARLTPNQSVGLLRWAETQLFGGENYLTFLPVSGYKGTLRERLSAPDVAYRVWAKTGTLNYGSGLAGYMLSHSNRRLAFALFISDFEKRRLNDETPPDKAAVQGADAWIERARQVQDLLVTKWVREY